MNYVKSITLNLFGILVNETMEFSSNLNIISGENGTCKTNILKKIKANSGTIFNDPTNQVRIHAISPKRNSERKSIETIIQQFKSQNRTYDTYINERLNSSINDHTFETYPSFGDLFYLSYDKLCRDGGNQIEYMQQVTQQFNTVIKKVFENYEFTTTWNEIQGTPDLKIRKNNIQEIPLQSLSSGEQEILSLILNLHSSKDAIDLYIIDEPEIHLNWFLEDKLFAFLLDFSINNNKQIILSTHSRVIFKSEFLSKCQFLYWTNEHVKISSNLSDKHKKSLAGEAIDIIKLGDFSKPTFFIEDNNHKLIIEKIATILEKEVSTSVAGNSPNIKSLFKLSKNDGGWSNSYFLIDGDNQGNPFPGEKRFIHLNKYCIENYFLDYRIISNAFNKTEDEIKELITDSIKERKNSILHKNKFFEFLIDRLSKDDISHNALEKIDASEIIESFAKKLGVSKTVYIDIYLKFCSENLLLNLVFPKELISAILNENNSENESEI